MTDAEAKAAVAVLMAAFPDMRGDEATIEIYSIGLQDLEYALVSAAIHSLIRTADRYMPRIAEIRARAIELRDGPRRTGVEAWGSVVRAMKAKGSHRTMGVDFVFDDPITTLVVASLGWTELCAGDADNQMSNRARFIDAYNQIAADDVKARQSGGLLPDRVSPKRLERGGDAAVPLAQLMPGRKLDPWEE